MGDSLPGPGGVRGQIHFVSIWRILLLACEAQVKHGRRARVTPDAVSNGGSSLGVVFSDTIMDLTRKGTVEKLGRSVCVCVCVCVSKVQLRPDCAQTDASHT